MSGPSPGVPLCSLSFLASFKTGTRGSLTPACHFPLPEMQGDLQAGIQVCFTEVFKVMTQLACPSQNIFCSSVKLGKWQIHFKIKSFVQICSFLQKQDGGWNNYLFLGMLNFFFRNIFLNIICYLFLILFSDEKQQETERGRNNRGGELVMSSPIITDKTRRIPDDNESNQHIGFWVQVISEFSHGRNASICSFWVAVAWSFQLFLYFLGVS